MNLVHLTASPSFGGPERQMLELGQQLRPNHRSVYLTFEEEGRCVDFVREAQARDFVSTALKHDTPHLWAAYRELLQLLREHQTDILLCNGYKAGFLGRIAARSLRIPVIAVSRGWTGESFRVRIFDWLDKINLRWMDRVVCVSEGQAAKVRRAGVRTDKLTVIRNAIRPGRFETYVPEYREHLRSLFAKAPSLIIGSAGRLSPEKGFEVLVEAFEKVTQSLPDVGLVLFGNGPERPKLEQKIEAAGLKERIVLPGYRDDLDQFMPHFDLFVQSSFTEGLPNVILEAFAAGTAVVATDVGGTAEVVREGVDGYLVPPRNPEALARQMLDLLQDRARRESMGREGQLRVQQQFSFESQALAYQQLFDKLNVCRPLATV